MLLETMSGKGTEVGRSFQELKAIIDRVKVLRNYGSDYRYHNIAMGYNDRLDELQAGLLRVKLKHIKDLLAKDMAIETY